MIARRYACRDVPSIAISGPGQRDLVASHCLKNRYETFYNPEPLGQCAREEI
jgi:hypothetical protein